jgi:predicted ATPase
MAFVGRARALSRLLAVVEEASSGRARLVLVAGEAGIGKTTLIGEATARSGLLVGWGACAEAERMPAFWPWTLALRGLLSALDPTDAEALTRIDTAELARLLPELAAAGSEVADAGVVNGPSDADAARLFDAVARLLERLARQAPTLVVLDDLHWADESSLQLLRFVAAPYRPVPLVIVGAYRHDELGAGAARTLAELAAHGELVQLHGLSQQEVFELIVDAVGVLAADRWAVEVHRRTEGHPFFARQLIEVLADPVQPPGTVPAAAHDLVARRVERLSADCRALVEAAMVAGNELLPDVLGEVCGLESATVALLLEEGVRAGVLARDAEGSRTRLAHDLFGQRPGVAFGFHLCRGNQQSRWLVEGGYDWLAQRLFPRHPRRVAAPRVRRRALRWIRATCRGTARQDRHPWARHDEDSTAGNHRRAPNAHPRGSTPHAARAPRAVFAVRVLHLHPRQRSHRRRRAGQAPDDRCDRGARLG